MFSQELKKVIHGGLYFSILQLLLVSASSLGAQSQALTDCGADHFYKADAAYFEPLRQRQDSLENVLYQQKSLGVPPKNSLLPPPYIIPTVFHIIHENGVENISDARALQALEWLNESFANVDYYDRGTGVPTQIQFCLAQRDPDNNPTTGITRHESPLTEVTFATDLSMKNLARWNPREYLNVYVVREICRSEGSGCNVAGYAYYPGAHGSGVDGIVVEARFTGNTEAGNVVLTHEVGHYLGLRHTFDGGCGNDDCLLDGDRVCDTPPDQSTAGIPCDQSMNSCSTDTNSGFATDQEDMINNYMDYSRFSCYDAFTQGQTDRMHFFLEGIRASLLSSPGCLPPCPNPVTAAFTPSTPNEVEVGTTVNFTNNSTAANGYTWRINGNVEGNTNNFSYTFPNEGFYTILLEASSSEPLCFPRSFSWSVRVSCSLDPAFNRNITFPFVGDTLSFSAADATATSYAYTLNGSLVATTASFDTSLLVPGLYELCLEIERANCRRRSCRFFAVRTPTPPSPDTCGVSGSQFVQRYAPDFDVLLGQRLLACDSNKVALVGVGQGTLTLVLQDALGNYQEGHTYYLLGSDLTVIDYLLAAGDSLYIFGNTGSFNTSTSSRVGFIMQVNLVNPDQFLIVRQEEVSRYATATLRNTPAGQELLYLGVRRNMGLNAFDRVFLQSLNLATLALSGTTEATYSSGGGLTVLDGLSDGSELIALGSRSSPINLENPVYYRWQQAGTFSEALHLPPIQTASQKPISIVREGMETFVLYSNLGGAGSAPGGFYLSKFTAAGQRFVRYYQSSDLLLMEAKGLTFRNGQLLLIGEDRSNGSLFLCRINTNTGDPMWALRFSSSEGWLQLNSSGNQLMHIHNDESVQFVATLLGGGPDAGQTEMLVVRSRLDELPASSCFQAIPVEVLATPWQNQWQTLSITEEATGPVLDFNEAGTEPFSPLPVGACGLPCEEDPGGGGNPNPEICGNGIDDDGNGFTDCEDPALVLTCCCLPPPSIDLGPDTAFCPNQFAGLRLEVAGSFSQYQWQDGSSNDYFIANTVGFYSLIVTDSCGKSDTASIRLTALPEEPTLELGPDQTYCDNGVLQLDVGSGWTSILWSDFSQEQSATFYEEGQHWVTVSDACGRQQSDTVRLTILPSTALDLPDEIILCAGDSITISLNGFEDYQWLPSSAAACPGCSENTFPAPPADGSVQIITVLASTASGQCVSVDSLLLRTRSPQPITELGLRTVCEGDSLLIFGEYRSQAGIYTRLLQDQWGCDSLLSVVLQLEAPQINEQTLFICPGETALLFGEPQSLPGVYEQRFQAASGCDSIVRLSLEWLDAPLANFEVEAACGDSLARVEISVAGGEQPYQLRWMDGNNENTRFLPSGSYALLVMDANACRDSLVVVVNTIPAEDLLLQLPDTLRMQVGDTLRLSPEIVGNPATWNFSWFPTEGIGCDTCRELLRFPLLRSGLYTLSLRSPEGCELQASTYVLLSFPPAPSLYLPNAFSPNGDGTNDRWWPQSAGDGEILEITLLQIHERWGGIVMEARNFPPDDPQFGWDGTHKGQALGQGVYIYHIRATLHDGSSLQLAGELVLLR